MKKVEKERLNAHVRNGGWLCVGEDLSVSPERGRTINHLVQFLEGLCGWQGVKSCVVGVVDL